MAVIAMRTAMPKTSVNENRSVTSAWKGSSFLFFPAAAFSDLLRPALLHKIKSIQKSFNLHFGEVLAI